MPVRDTYEAMLVLNTLTRYDLFQSTHGIRPDFSNAGGLDVWEDGEWVTWYSDDGEDIDEYTERMGMDEIGYF